MGREIGATAGEDVPAQRGGGVDRAAAAAKAAEADAAKAKAAREANIARYKQTQADIAARYPNAAIPTEETASVPEPQVPTATGRQYDPDAHGAYHPRTMMEWLGFAEGGAIPDENEGQDPGLQYAGLRTDDMQAPAPAEPAAAAEAVTRKVRPERARYEARQATPKLKQDVSEAVRGGAGFLQRIFGLDQGQSDGIDTPEAQQTRQAGAQRFASGEGAATQEEIQAIDDKIDPDRQLTEGHRQMVRLAKTMKWYRDQGREDDAKASAGSLLQYGAQRFGKLGSMAGAAYRHYEQTGNKQDLENTVRFLEQAYDMIPDGADMQVELNEKTGKLEAYRTDAEGNEEKFEISARELPGFIRKTMDNSLYWQNVLATANPSLALHRETVRDTTKAKQEERKYGRTEEERKNAREVSETIETEGRAEQRKLAEEERAGAAKKAETEAANIESDRRAKRDAQIQEEAKLRDEALARDREARKAGKDGTYNDAAFKQTFGPATEARTALAADPENPQLQDAYNESLSRLVDAVGKDKQDLIRDWGFNVDNFVYKAASNLMKRESDKPPAEYPDAKPGRDKAGNPIWVIEKDGKKYGIPVS